jgi:hypothetical protein
MEKSLPEMPWGNVSRHFAAVRRKLFDRAVGGPDENIRTIL